jgi:hypothetical protein
MPSETYNYVCRDEHFSGAFSFQNDLKKETLLIAIGFQLSFRVWHLEENQKELKLNRTCYLLGTVNEVTSVDGKINASKKKIQKLNCAVGRLV